ncbi:MAG: Rieske (2Fe-2S) protein [Candidatus Nitrosocosmicus sp.]
MNACKVGVLNNDKLMAFKYNDEEILVARVKAKLYVTDRIFTNEYADLSTGFLNEEKTIACPLHISRFELETGISQNPPPRMSSKTYEMKIEEGGVYI